MTTANTQFVICLDPSHTFGNPLYLIRCDINGYVKEATKVQSDALHFKSFDEAHTIAVGILGFSRSSIVVKTVSPPRPVCGYCGQNTILNDDGDCRICVDEMTGH